MASFDDIRTVARSSLAEFLDKYAGTKVLVWDEKLTGPFDLIAKFNFFKERQVVKMFPLRCGRLPSYNAENVIFITRTESRLMEMIADNVKRAEAVVPAARTEFHILFVPQASEHCNLKLKELGVYGSFTFKDELSIFWFPLDTDVISLEMSSVFRDYHLDEDSTVLTPIAKALLSLQSVYGVIPNVYGKGKAAKQIYSYLLQMRKETMGEEPQEPTAIDNIIIIDRQIDLISPLVTQLTYEGLIDEIFGIKNTSVKLPAHRFVNEDSPAEERNLDTDNGNPFDTEMKSFPLTSNEEVYAEIRDKNFNAVGSTLSRQARSVSAQFEERHDAKTVRELKTFVDRLPQMRQLRQSLSTHTAIAEMIKEHTDQREFPDALQVEQEFLNYQNTDRPHDYIEESTLWELPIHRVLRIACLQSLVNSGLKPKVLQAYRHTIMQAYGPRYLPSFLSLQKVGLLSPQGSTRNYAVLRKRLKLTLDDVDEQEPKDIAYVHSVYAPLSIRLIENFAKPGWKAIRKEGLTTGKTFLGNLKDITFNCDVLDMLPGPIVDERQSVSPALQSRRNRSGNELTRTLVLFVGGCTYAEISALRFLSQQEDSNTEYLIATTSIINSERFIKSVMDSPEDVMRPTIDQ